MGDKPEDSDLPDDLVVIYIDPPGLPRWVTLSVGILLAPLVVLCLAVSVGITVSGVGKSAIFDLAVGIVMTIVSLWLLVVCWRLISGRKVHGGLFSSKVYTLISWIYVGLALSVLLSGELYTNPLISCARILGCIVLFLLFRNVALIDRENEV